MVKVLNTKESLADNELPFATDKECRDRRRLLISKGVIKPCDKSKILYNRAGLPVLSTRKGCRQWRQNLIKRGIIKPVVDSESGTVTFCKLVSRDTYIRRINGEEGEYHVRPIKSSTEYHRRRQAYFRMIQEIFYARKTLRLVLGKKKETDPEWYF